MAEVQGANPFLLNAERMLRNVETGDDRPHGVGDEKLLRYKKRVFQNKFLVLIFMVIGNQPNLQ